MSDHNCIFLSGPLDGKMIRVPDYLHEYRAMETKPIPCTFAKPTLSDLMERSYIEHRYFRTSSKTFLHESEGRVPRFIFGAL